MKRPHNRLIILLMSLASSVLLSENVGIGVAPASAAENGTMCDIQRGPCLKETDDGMTVGFDVRPKPVVALSELTFVVNLAQGGMPVTDASVVLDLSMPGMFMGKNQPILNHRNNGRYDGKGVIPRCSSGKKMWQAEVTINRAGKSTVVDFVFEVK